MDIFSPTPAAFFLFLGSIVQRKNKNDECSLPHKDFVIQSHWQEAYLKFFSAFSGFQFIFIPFALTCALHILM